MRGNSTPSRIVIDCITDERACMYRTSYTYIVLLLQINSPIYRHFQRLDNTRECFKFHYIRYTLHIRVYTKSQPFQIHQTRWPVETWALKGVILYATYLTVCNSNPWERENHPLLNSPRVLFTKELAVRPIQWFLKRSSLQWLKKSNFFNVYDSGEGATTTLRLKKFQIANIFQKI